MKEITIRNNEAAKELAVAIVDQACSDYEYILKNGNIGERRVGQTKVSLEKFFNDNGVYFEHLNINGPKILRQMKENFSKYGKVRVPYDEKAAEAI